MDKTVKGSTLIPQLITWERTDDLPQDLTGFTITAKLYSIERRTSRSVTGSISVVTAVDGEFQWIRSALDVSEEGVFEVQFIGTTVSGTAISYSTIWEVLPAR